MVNCSELMTNMLGRATEFSEPKSAISWREGMMTVSACVIEVEEDDLDSGAGPGVGKGSSHGSRTTLR